MEKLTVRVDGLTWREYSTAIRMMALVNGLWMTIGVPAALIVMAVVLRDVKAAGLIAAVIVVMLIWRYGISDRRNYNKATIRETELLYEMDGRAWRLTVAGQSGVCTWVETVRLVETGSCLLLYSARKNSSVLPKRCLTPEQISQIKDWYQAGHAQLKRAGKS